MSAPKAFTKRVYETLSSLVEKKLEEHKIVMANEVCNCGTSFTDSRKRNLKTSTTRPGRWHPENIAKAPKGVRLQGEETEVNELDVSTMSKYRDAAIAKIRMQGKDTSKRSTGYQRAARLINKQRSDGSNYKGVKTRPGHMSGASADYGRKGAYHGD